MARYTARELLFLSGLETGIMSSNPSWIACDYPPFFLCCSINDRIVCLDALNSEIQLINECHLCEIGSTFPFSSWYFIF